MVPELHEQWRSLNFGRLLTERAAFISIDAQNSILDASGVLSHEGIWKGARDDDGSLSNIIRLAASVREVGIPLFWLRYDRFIGEKQASTELDRVQYNHWNENYAEILLVRNGNATWCRTSRQFCDREMCRSYTRVGASSLAQAWIDG